MTSFRSQYLLLLPLRNNFPFDFALRSVPGRDFLELFEDILTVPKESVFHRDKFIFWNMEDLQPISDTEQTAFCEVYMK